MSGYKDVCLRITVRCHSAGLVMSNGDPLDRSFYPLLTLMILVLSIYDIGLQVVYMCVKLNEWLPYVLDVLNLFSYCLHFWASYSNDSQT